MELVCLILFLLLPIPTLFTYLLGFDIPTYSIIFIENVFYYLIIIYLCSYNDQKVYFRWFITKRFSSIYYKSYILSVLKNCRENTLRITCTAHDLKYVELESNFHGECLECSML